MFRANIIIKLFIMKKQFLNLGKALNKAEQKQISGGLRYICGSCSPNYNCCTNDGICGLIGYGGLCYAS